MDKICRVDGKVLGLERSSFPTCILAELINYVQRGRQVRQVLDMIDITVMIDNPVKYSNAAGVQEGLLNMGQVGVKNNEGLETALGRSL